SDRRSRTELECALQGGTRVCLFSLLGEQAAQVVVSGGELVIELHGGPVVFQSAGFVPFTLTTGAPPHVQVGRRLLHYGLVQETEALVEGLELVVVGGDGGSILLVVGGDFLQLGE